MSNGLTNAAASNQKLEAVRKVIETYKDKQGCLIAVLHLSQEIYGYLPEEVQRLVAEELGFSPSYVSSVVSFYSFFSTTPRARHASPSAFRSAIKPVENCALETIKTFV